MTPGETEEQQVQGMEAAIRNALSRAERPDEATRARIYNSARTALQRSLEKRGISDPAVHQQQLQRLDELVARIEGEYRPQPGVTETGPIPAEAPPHVQGETRRGPGAQQGQRPQEARAGFTPTAPGERREPGFGAPPPEVGPQSPAQAPILGPAEREPSLAAAPNLDHPSGPSHFSHGSPHPAAPDDRLALPPDARQAAEPPQGKGRRKREQKPRRRNPFASAFSGIVLLLLLGIGIWWVLQSGAFQSATDGGTADRSPTVAQEETGDDSYAPRPLNPEAGFSGNWTMVFEPGAEVQVDAGSEASVNLIERQGGAVLEIQSQGGSENGEVRIPIDAALLQEFAGQRAIMALTVRSAGSEPARFYVECDFGGLGDCGRRRFSAGFEPTDALVELDFTDRTASPDQAAILINSDITGAGQAIELHAIRIRPAE